MESSSLINHLRGLSTHEVVAFHYCDFADKHTLKPTGVLGSLVRQLVVQMNKIPASAQSLYHKYSGEPLELEALATLLEEVANQDLRSIYLIIDGLDECPNDVECSHRSRLLRGIVLPHKAFEATAAVKVLVSSRSEYDIQQAFRDKPSFSLQSRHVREDVETHVRAEITKMPRLWKMPPEDRESLVSELVERADGTFQWAQCQLQVLRKIKTPQALRDALDTLPSGLYETYDRLLGRIDTSDYEYVFRALKWLIGAKRPLLLKELVEAVALDPRNSRFDTRARLFLPEDILSLCSSLIRIMDDQTVVLSYFSVQEYLLSSHIAQRG